MSASAKELKATADIGATLGYSGEELGQFVHNERMRMNKEKEKQREIDENERQQKFELQKLKV